MHVIGIWERDYMQAPPTQPSNLRMHTTHYRVVKTFDPKLFAHANVIYVFEQEIQNLQNTPS